MNASEILQQPYTYITVRDGEGVYHAEILEFPGLLAHGITRDEATRRIEQMAGEWVEAEVALGRTIPPPVTVR